MQGKRRGAAVAVLSGVAVLTGLAGAPTATADVAYGVGHETSPAQPYQGNPDESDWVGSYRVGGDQVWCVQFAYRAPDSDQQYQPGDELRTKWGTALPADVAADISYLLLRYGDTTDDDEAAALAHLLHTWTSGPRSPDQLDPGNDFRHIAYDERFHLTTLPAGARTAVDTLRADAERNRGPWTAEVTEPKSAQVIGTADTWTIRVRNAAGAGVGDVPVTLTLADAELTDAATRQEAVIPTPADGGPVTVEVTPTGPNPTVDISLASPAEVPVVRDALQADTQRIVSTGGEDELTARAATTASRAPAPAPTTPSVPQAIPAGDAPVQQATGPTPGAPFGPATVLAVLGLVLLAVGLVRRRTHSAGSPGRHRR